MEFLILVVVVIVALYIFNLGGVKQHRRNLQDEIEKSLDKSYKPFTAEEKKRWQEILKDIEADKRNKNHRKNEEQEAYHKKDNLKEKAFDGVPQTNYYPEIKRFLEKRGIKYLVHFTDAANISSIKRNGLLSRAFLQRRGMGFRFNDNVRLDDSLDYISLSITNHNKDVYQSFVKKGSIQRGAFIYIDASILYKESNDRLYCVTNAASAKCPKGRTLSDLEQMFDDVVYFKANGIEQQKVRYDKADNEPTHEQAEILYQGSIDPKYIICIEYSSPMNDDFDDFDDFDDLDDIPF